MARQFSFDSADRMRDDDPRPVAPARPDPQDCCGGGCSPCIFEQYDDAMERYEQALLRWNERQRQRS